MCVCIGTITFVTRRKLDITNLIKNLINYNNIIKTIESDYNPSEFICKTYSFYCLRLRVAGEISINLLSIQPTSLRYKIEVPIVLLTTVLPLNVNHYSQKALNRTIVCNAIMYLKPSFGFVRSNGPI